MNTEEPCVTLITGGHNLLQDDTCNPTLTDLVVGSAELWLSIDNGGPIWMHALLAGSPALDASDDYVCPATYQSGVTRQQVPYSDIGAFEAEVL